jgi:hypothetical protein
MNHHTPNNLDPCIAALRMGAGVYCFPKFGVGMITECRYIRRVEDKYYVYSALAYKINPEGAQPIGGEESGEVEFTDLIKNFTLVELSLEPPSFCDNLDDSDGDNYDE